MLYFRRALSAVLFMLQRLCMVRFLLCLVDSPTYPHKDKYMVEAEGAAALFLLCFFYRAPRARASQRGCFFHVAAPHKLSSGLHPSWPGGRFKERLAVRPFRCARQIWTCARRRRIRSNQAVSFESWGICGINTHRAPERPCCYDGTTGYVHIVVWIATP